MRKSIVTEFAETGAVGCVFGCYVYSLLADCRYGVSCLVTSDAAFSCTEVFGKIANV